MWIRKTYPLYFRHMNIRKRAVLIALGILVALIQFMKLLDCLWVILRQWKNRFLNKRKLLVYLTLCSLLIVFLIRMLYVFMFALVAQRVKRLPTTQEIWVWSLGQEDPTEKEMETHYIIIKNKPTGRKQEKKLYEQKRSSQMLVSCRRWSSQGQTTDQNSLKSIGLSLTVGCLWRPTWPTRIYANVSEFQLFGVLTV